MTCNEEVPPECGIDKLKIAAKRVRRLEGLYKIGLKLDLGCPKERCAYDCHTH